MLIRISDLLISLVVFFVLLPLFLIVAILIYIEDKGNPFFLQIRVGKDRKLFKIYKFRSMKIDKNRFLGSALNELSLAEKKDMRQSFVTTSVSDQRVTKVGKLIRKTSIDELPQLINVIRGEMSIVGPRPDTPIQEVDYLQQEWIGRHRVVPGITGLAQINGRSNISHENRIKLDLEYAEKKNILLYIEVIFKTAFNLVFKNKSAF